MQIFNVFGEEWQAEVERPGGSFLDTSIGVLLDAWESIPDADLTGLRWAICHADQIGVKNLGRVADLEHVESVQAMVFREGFVSLGGQTQPAYTIAVHPDDDRHRHLVGRTVRHPLDGRELPIVADEAVDPSFGTGAVKVTPAHDLTDFDIAGRAGAPVRNILTAEAILNDTVPEEFRGLDRYEGRRRVLERLRELDLVVREERPYPHAVGHCYRCHTEIEPWLSGKQWFVSVGRLTGPAKEAAGSGRVRFFPERWVGPYTAWLDNLRDWNISRQLWWGHQLPIWYCPDGHATCAWPAPEACAECGSGELERDPDVLDTWFSSALWPHSTMGWPEQTPELRYYYPTSVLVTNRDIITLWVARMVITGLYNVGQVPFHHVYIHPKMLDGFGEGMSKSKGNVIDPLEVIEQYGADALRFTLAAMAAQGRDIKLSAQRVEGYRNFATKLWNAARFAEVNGCARVAGFDPKTTKETLNRWIAHETAKTSREVTEALESYRFNEAAGTVYRFVWNIYCDWYLELSKPVLMGPDGAAKSEMRAMTAWALDEILKLLHPFMPFLTEELWRVTAEQGPKRDHLLVLAACQGDAPLVVGGIGAGRCGLVAVRAVAPSSCHGGTTRWRGHENLLGRWCEAGDCWLFACDESQE